jgi:pseudouridine synthase
MLPAFIDPENDIVTVDEENLEPASPEGQEKVYYLLNKPKGILVTNFDPSERKTVSELMDGVKERLFPVGRLDMDSRGALIMTNDGELANRLTHPRYGIEKTYIVEVEGRMTPEDVERVKRGAWLGPVPGKGGRGPRQGGARTDRFHIKVLGRERGRTILEATVAESKNREIRRVMARIGHPVRDLNRVAIAERITIKNLPVGEYRKLSADEVEWLFEASSKEHHERDRAATQQWYEQKEMAKERKRLDEESAAERERQSRERKRAPGDPANFGSDASRKPRERRERPVKKGKKPFIPPSGRNAGKLMGGDKLGRKNFSQQQRTDEAREEFDDLPKMKLPPTPNVQHPLGNAAKNDDE